MNQSFLYKKSAAREDGQFAPGTDPREVKKLQKLQMLARANSQRPITHIKNGKLLLANKK